MSVRKALIYATGARGLLVFDEPDFPEVPLQIPGGTIDPGETPIFAAAREFAEETGLACPPLRALGGFDYRRDDAGTARLYRRHYFHARLTGDLPSQWLHTEHHASNGAEPIRFRLHFVTLAEASRHLGLGLAQALHLIRESWNKTGRP